MKNFTDIKIGDTVICYDEYLHDYIEHKLEITNIEYDKEYITETNPTGMICFGNDLTCDDEEMMITRVDEGNFTKII